jgi:hypothetical protein
MKKLRKFYSEKMYPIIEGIFYIIAMLVIIFGFIVIGCLILKTIIFVADIIL